MERKFTISVPNGVLLLQRARPMEIPLASLAKGRLLQETATCVVSCFRRLNLGLRQYPTSSVIRNQNISTGRKLGHFALNLARTTSKAGQRRKDKGLPARPPSPRVLTLYCLHVNL
jgi:hypothetical protein